MKNVSFLLLGIVVAFSLGFTACDNGSTTDPYGLPRLNRIYLITEAEGQNGGLDFQNNRTSFGVNQGVGVFTIGDNFSPHSLSRIYFTLKIGNDVLNISNYPIDNIPGATEPDASGQYIYYSFWNRSVNMGTFERIGTDYSIEVYVVDTAGNRSNTLSKNFAIIAD